MFGGGGGFSCKGKRLSHEIQSVSQMGKKSNFILFSGFDFEKQNNQIQIEFSRNSNNF